MTTRWWGLVLIGLLVRTAGGVAQTAWPEAAEPTADPMPDAVVQAEYQQVIGAAIAEFDAGRYVEARALFTRAHALWPSARTLRTLGMTAFELRLYPQALAELEAACADPRRPLPAGQRSQVLSLIAQVHAFVGRYAIHVSPADAEISIDGVPLRLDGSGRVVLATGEHELRARAADYLPLRRALQVAGNEQETLMLVLEAVAYPRPVATALRAAPAPAITAHEVRAVATETRSDARQNVAYGAFGVGALGVLTSAVTGGLALSHKHSLRGHCPDHRCPPQYVAEMDAMKRFANASTAAAVIGGVGVALGTSLWLWARRGRGAHLKVAAGLGPPNLAISGEF